ncbi:MAG: AsmA family protein [Alphaproteobacteria bacterium]|nr:AsmA family protein [Alphaproteobacteria bacterium]
MIKKIILISLGVLILIGGGLTAYVATLDWNAHKDKIATEISNMIGEKFEFTGNLDVSLLPHPHMYATDIKIINPSTSEKLAEIKKMETVVSLRSILRKTPDIQSLVMEDVEMWIKVDDEGKTNWHQEGEPQFINAEVQSRLQNFTLKNTNLHFVYPKYDINADLSSSSTDVQTHSLAGPYTITGSFKKDNEIFGVSVSIESFSQIDDIALNFIIMHEKTKSYLRYDGKYNLSSDHFEGDFSGNSDRTADFVNILLGKNVLEDTYNKPLMFSVAAKSTSKEFNLSHFVIKFAKFIEGAGDIVIPRKAAEEGAKPVIDIKYQLLALDLRPFIAIAKSKFNDYQKETSYEPNTEYDAEFELTAEKVVVSDLPTGYFDNMRARGTWKDNVFSLDDYYAGCQGNIIWTMSGSLAEESSTPRYYAKLAFEGQNFLNLINSFDDTITAPTQSAYRNGKISFDVFGDTKAVKLSNIDISFDKMKMLADAEIALDRKAYTINLKTDKINIDNYVARNPDAVGIKDILIADSKKLDWLQNTALKLHAEAGEATFRTITFNNAEIDMDVQDGVINIKDAKCDNLLGSKVDLTATIKGIGTENLSVENADYELTSVDLKSLLSKMEIPHPDWPLLEQNNFVSSGTVSGNFETAEIDVKNTIEDIRWDYKGTISKKDKKVAVNGETSVKSPNFQSFVAMLGGDVNDKNALKGVFNGTGKIDGNGNHWTINDADGQFGFSKFKGNLDIKKVKSKYVVKADVNTNELNLESIIGIQGSKTGQRKEDLFDDSFIARPVLSRDSIDYETYRNIDFDVLLNAERVVYKNKSFHDVKVHAVNNQNNLQLQDLNFRYKEAEYSGNVQITYIQDPRAKGTMDIRDIDVAEVGGKIYKFDSGILHLNGDFDAPAGSFEEFIHGISGNFAFDMGIFTMQGFNFSAISEDLSQREYSKGVFQMVRDNLQSGATTFDSFTGSADMKDGTITLRTAKIKNEEVDLTVNGKISLSEWKMNTDTIVKYLKTTNIPDFSFLLTGMINKPVLDISVESIVKKYDSHWEKIEQEKQAKKDEELRHLQEKMAAAQKKTISVADKVSEAIPVIEQYSRKTISNATLAQYQAKSERLSKISQSIDAMQSLSRQTDYTLEDVHQIEEKCPVLVSEIDDILNDSRKIYLDDIAERMNNIKNAAEEIDANNKKLYDDYQKMLQDDFDELLKINASQYFVNNADLKSQQGEISNYNSSLIDMYDVFNNKVEASKSYISTEDQEVALVDLQQRIEQMQITLEQMEKVRSKSADLLLNMINERRVIYEEEQAAKEAKRKKEQAENAGNLLATESEIDEDIDNKNDTEAESLDNSQPTPLSGIITQGTQQPNSEQQSGGKVSGVLKAGSGGSEKVSGTITKSYDDSKDSRPVSGNGYLKPIEGDVQKTTGTITVK